VNKQLTEKGTKKCICRIFYLYCCIIYYWSWIHGSNWGCKRSFVAYRVSKWIGCSVSWVQLHCDSRVLFIL